MVLKTVQHANYVIQKNSERLQVFYWVLTGNIVTKKSGEMLISSTTLSKRAENGLKTSRALDDHQPLSQPKSFKECFVSPSSR